MQGKVSNWSVLANSQFSLVYTQMHSVFYCHLIVLCAINVLKIKQRRFENQVYVYTCSHVRVFRYLLSIISVPNCADVFSSAGLLLFFVLVGRSLQVNLSNSQYHRRKCLLNFYSKKGQNIKTFSLENDSRFSKNDLHDICYVIIAYTFGSRFSFEYCSRVF